MPTVVMGGAHRVTLEWKFVSPFAAGSELNGLKQHRPEAVFCLYWSSWTERPRGIPKLRRQAIIHQQHPVELLTDPWSLTREDLAQP